MKKPPKITLIVVLVSILGLLCFPAGVVEAATVLNVPSASYPTIQSAITAASSGDTVQVAAGTYYERIALKEGVRVLGAGASVTTIDSNSSGAVVVAYNIPPNSSTELDGFTITHGYSGFGGGIYCDQSSPTISNCVISFNNGTSRGGGMYNTGSSPIVTNCTFLSNICYSGAGMGNSNGSSPIISNCIFYNNSVWSSGGAMNNESSSSPIITNSIFYNNRADQLGGAMFISGSSTWPKLTNCTISGNSGMLAGGIYNSGANITLTNCILWGDTSAEISGSPAVVNYCDIHGLYPGTGNLNSNPLFVNPGAGNYYLQPGSPCIDNGTNSAPSLPGLDFDGGLRTKYGGQVGSTLSPITDMGAYELGMTDLAVTKSDSPDPVIAGTDLSYLISVTNNGPSDATRVSVKDTIPAGTTHSSDNTSQGAYTAGIWDVGNLAVGVSANMTLVVKVNSGATDNISNTASVSGYVTDSDQNNDSAAENTTVITRTDLSITKTGDLGVVTGTGFAYALSVTNNGPSDATHVRVTDILPAGAAYYKSTPSKGTYDQNTGIWTVDGLTSGENAVLNIEVTANALPNTVITNTAYITGNETDPVANNNSDSQDTRVVTSVGGEVKGISKWGILTFWLSWCTILVIGGAFLLFRRFKDY